VLGSLLKDRAQVLRRERSPVRDSEGGYPIVEVRGQRFRCVYAPDGEDESRDDGKVKRTEGATLTFGKRDLSGAPLVVGADDRIEIQSHRYGTFQMEIEGTPDPLVRSRTRIGYTARLRKTAR
jgi:hypothetical protein